MIATQKRYLTCAETAKLIRLALKREFPGQKFSVRSHVYAGGASINVDWTDGPTDDAVSAVTSAYSGAGFDGMIDLKYYVTTWLAKDGTVRVAHSPGTESSRGSVPEFVDEPPSLDAELVHMGADYVFTHRTISPWIMERAKRHVAEDYRGLSAYEAETQVYRTVRELAFTSKVDLPTIYGGTSHGTHDEPR